MESLKVLISMLLLSTTSPIAKATSSLHGDANECSCSLLMNISKVKCHLQPSNPGESAECTLVFEQANEDFDTPHTKCIGRNEFSTVGEYTGALRQIILYCKPFHPMNLSFDGMLPHQSIGISNYRQSVLNGVKYMNQSLMIVSMSVEPEITGRYVITKYNNDGGQHQEIVSLYIFAENGRSGPYLLHSGKTISPKFVNETRLIIPCRTFKHTTTILVKKDGKVFRGFKYFDPRLGFVLEAQNNQFEPYFGLYECIPNISITDEHQGMMDDSVKLIVNEETFIRNAGMKMTNERNGLNLNVSGKWVSCTSDEKWRRDYRLVNMRARNPMEANLKKLCFVGNEECVGKREGSFNRCYSSSRYCKAVDFKEGGGMISCFSRNDDSFKEPHHYVLGLNGKTYINPDTKVVPINALLNLEMQNRSEYYTDILYNISCIGLGYLFAQPLMIYVVLTNGTRILVSNPKMFDDNSFREIYDISSTNVVFNNYKIQSIASFSLDVSSVSCSAFVWNSEETLEYQIPITVYLSKKPQFSLKQSKAAFILGQTSELDCDYEALPEPKISWEKDGEIIPNVVSKQLVVSNTTHKSAGAYLCIVTNELGRATKSFIVDVEESPGELSLWIVIGIPLTVVLICTVALGILLRYYKQPRNGLSREEIKEFMNGIEVTLGAAKENNCEAMISSAPYSKEYEVVTGDFVIDETTLLGMGEYGMVYRGMIGERDVAVKTLKPNANVGYLRSLLSELKVMIYLKDHPNVVNLVGANTQHLQKGLLYIMVEFCPLGDLQNYLQKNRRNFIDEFCVSDYDNSDIQKRDYVDVDPLSTRDLLHWSVQIASGMEYLAAKNVIHGDLAARNVLLQNRNTAKVSDFGLSRKLYEYSNYVKQSQEPLPWRHLALESLKDLKFSTTSDVWAFGVTLWEIFSLGEVPYPGQNWNLDFVEQLENGLRMRKPRYSNETIFELQVDCWNKEEQKRPTFPAIKSQLEKVVLSLNSASY